LNDRSLLCTPTAGPSRPYFQLFNRRDSAFFPTTTFNYGTHRSSLEAPPRLLRSLTFLRHPIIHRPLVPSPFSLTFSTAHLDVTLCASEWDSLAIYMTDLVHDCLDGRIYGAQSKIVEPHLSRRAPKFCLPMAGTPFVAPKELNINR